MSLHDRRRRSHREHASSSDLRSQDSDIVTWCTSPSSNVEYHGRAELPAVMIHRNEVSIWEVLKRSVGKELTKITMPVVFNEPITFLQRIAEYLENYELLQQAAIETDPVKRMETVAAFAVSALASNWERVAKPFNPLLGETYELDRMEDLGIRIVCEQVSHHPPVSAFYADGDGFVFYGSIYPKIQFWGQTATIEPKGVITVELPKQRDIYTWTNVSCSVKNLIMGQLWIEQHGVMDIVSHSTGLRCTLHFKPTSNWFNRDYDSHIEGFILNRSKQHLRALYGHWTRFLASCDPATFESYCPIWGKEVNRLCARTNQSNIRTCSKEVDIPLITGSKMLWYVKPRPSCTKQVRLATLLC